MSFYADDLVLAAVLLRTTTDDYRLVVLAKNESRDKYAVLVSTRYARGVSTKRHEKDWSLVHDDRSRAASAGYFAAVCRSSETRDGFSVVWDRDKDGPYSGGLPKWHSTISWWRKVIITIDDLFAAPLKKQPREQLSIEEKEERVRELHAKRLADKRRKEQEYEQSRIVSRIGRFVQRRKE